MSYCQQERPPLHRCSSKFFFFFSTDNGIHRPPLSPPPAAWRHLRRHVPARTPLASLRRWAALASAHPLPIRLPFSPPRCFKPRAGRNRGGPGFTSSTAQAPSSPGPPRSPPHLAARLFSRYLLAAWRVPREPSLGTAAGPPVEASAVVSLL